MQTALFDDDCPVTISVNAFAKAVGVTEGAIRKAIKSGHIDAYVVLPSGKKMLDEEKARAQWATLHPEQPQSDGEQEQSEYTREKILLLKAQREKAELELADLRGQYHHTEDVRAVMEHMLASFRARMRAIPSTVTPMLGGVTDPVEINRILAALIDEGLLELSDYDPKKFKQARARRRRQAVSEA